MNILFYTFIMMYILPISFDAKKSITHKSIKRIFPLFDDNFNFLIYSIKLVNKTTIV